MVNPVMAQMSDEELALIFYDVISHYGLDNNYIYINLKIKLTCMVFWKILIRKLF